MFEQNSLDESLAAVGAKTDGATHRGLFEKLSAMYGGSGRHYHSQSHVIHCLAHLQAWRHLARNPAEIEVAIWFHDAIYCGCSNIRHDHGDEASSGRRRRYRPAGGHRSWDTGCQCCQFWSLRSSDSRGISLGAFGSLSN